MALSDADMSAISNVLFGYQYRDQEKYVREEIEKSIQKIKIAVETKQKIPMDMLENFSGILRDNEQRNYKSYKSLLNELRKGDIKRIDELRTHIHDIAHARAMYVIALG